MSTQRTKRLSYDEIEALAVQCEREGGYARRTGGPNGTELHIGETVLTEEDALEFVVRLNERLVSRGTGKLDEQSYRQGREDMLREVQETIGGLG